MKLALAFLLSLTNTFVFAQQKRFINYAKNTESYITDVFYISPDSSSNLVKLSNAVLSGEELILEIPLNPESSDEEKAGYVTLIKLIVEKIAHQNNQYNAVTVQVGEQIFISKDEVEKWSSKYKKIAKLNMKRAWKQLGAELTFQFPSAKIYGFNWNW